MKRILVGLIILALLSGLGFGVYTWQQTKIKDLGQQKNELQTQLQKANDSLSRLSNYAYKSNKGINIAVYTPLSNSKVSSPLTIIGQVPGNWSFEAQFSIQLKDSTGKVIAQNPAKLQGDWMTEALVPFTDTLEFNGLQSGTGTLVIIKDNPSGLPSNDDMLIIPVRF